MRIEDSQVNELAQLPLISHPGASCQPLLGDDWEWAKIIKLHQMFFSTWPLLALTSHWMYFGFKGWFVSFAQWNVSTILMSFILISLYHYQAGSSQLTVLFRVGMYMFYTILFLFVYFPSDLIFSYIFFPPQYVLSWEGTHYSYGYSAVPRIQQCIQVSVLLSLLNSYDFILPYWSACGNRICICASSLCKMGGWN